MPDDTATARTNDPARPGGRDDNAVSALSPVPTAPRENPGFAALRGLRSRAEPDDGVDAVADHLAHRHGALEASGNMAQVTAFVRSRREPRPRSPIAPDAEMPYEGEEIDWTGNLRADFPLYALEQLNEFAHRRKRTQVSALLLMMAAYRDADGNRVFYIREEDLVADRRKIGKGKGGSARRR